jgi:hypothetical protein
MMQPKQVQFWQDVGGFAAMAFVAFLIVLAFGWLTPVKAAPGWQNRVQPISDDPSVEPWIDAQTNSDGGSCCLTADAHVFNGDYELRADGSVDINVNGSTINIDAFKIILTPEPPGLNEAILWYSGVDPSQYDIWCFHPAALT